MGGGRTGNNALGRSAMTFAARAREAALIGIVTVLLGGCKDLSTVAAIAGGSATGAATGSPAIGIAVGIGVAAGGNFLVRYIARVRAGAEQDVIAETAGALPDGGKAAWAIRHTIPIGNEHGALWVVDAISTPLAACKKVVFSVVNGGAGAPQAWYTVDVCRDPKGWRWATAEPAVERWRPLQ